MLVVASLLSPYQESVWITACIYAIAAIGLYVTIASGQFSILHAALMGLGGYAAAITAVKFGWAFVPALCAGAAAGAASGIVVAVLLARMGGMLLAVATLAIGVAVSLVMANVNYVGGPLGFPGVPLRSTFGWVVGLLVAVVVLLLLVRRTTFGLALVACGKDEVVAEALGISRFRMRLWGFGVGGALAGLAGALLVQFLGVILPTDLGFAQETQLFVYAIIGGITTFWGAVLGAIGVTWGLELLRFSQADRYWILGLLLTVVVLIRPQGILVRRNLHLRGPDEGPLDRFAAEAASLRDAFLDGFGRIRGARPAVEPPIGPPGAEPGREDVPAVDRN